MATLRDNESLDDDDLKWVKVRKEDSEFQVPKSKFVTNFLVSVGVMSTSVVLGLGLCNMLIDNMPAQQRLMRYRVLFQGLTIAVASIGIAMADDKTLTLFRRGVVEKFSSTE